MALFLLHTVAAFILSFHRMLYQPVFPVSALVGHTQLFPLPATLSLPVKRLGSPELPTIQANTFIVVDETSGEVLAERNVETPFFPASTTKIMTAVIVIKTMNMDEVITVPADLPREGSSMNLVAGEQLTVRDLLLGLLVHSSNDAAILLARSYPGGEQAFIQAMNAKAQELHMTHTTYRNVSGLADPNHVTSVRDLVVLARYAMKNPFFAATVKKQQIIITSVDGKHKHILQTTNKLLGAVEGVEGIKTGWTEEAGECLVTQVNRDGHTVLLALLKSPDRFGETAKLIQWTYESYHWETRALREW